MKPPYAASRARFGRQQGRQRPDGHRLGLADLDLGRFSPRAGRGKEERADEGQRARHRHDDERSAEAADRGGEASDRRTGDGAGRLSGRDDAVGEGAARRLRDLCQVDAFGHDHRSPAEPGGGAPHQQPGGGRRGGDERVHRRIQPEARRHEASCAPSLGEESSTQLAGGIRDRKGAGHQPEHERRCAELAGVEGQEREHDRDPDLADEPDQGQQPEGRIDGPDETRGG